MNNLVSTYSGSEKEIIFEKFYEIVRSIPAGKVATYGQIAEMANQPGEARAVGQALSCLEHQDVPWHRVVTASGKIAMPTRPDLREKQRNLLLEEGIQFVVDYQVDMPRFDWQATQSQLDLF